MAVTYLASAYAALWTCLACAEWREVIVQKELLVVAVQHIVNEFLVELSAQSYCSERLSLATSEDR